MPPELLERIQGTEKSRVSSGSLLGNDEHLPNEETFGACYEPPPWRPLEGGRHFLSDTLLPLGGGVRGGVVFYFEALRETGVLLRTVSLWRLGPGAEGHRGLCHGGFLAAVLDNSLGITSFAHMRSLGSWKNQATAKMTVEYRAPVRVPGPLVVESKVEKREGRKIFLRAEIFSKKIGDQERELSSSAVENNGKENDSERTQLLKLVGEGEGLFLELKGKNLE